ncbi:LysR family transcriptional regulator [Comamonas resistens]|uniref:LysR family transcriptional regulator n=1 Tax=Comamonas resistens TaxID=3046670 RepID=A0ABY8SNT1_9BURK|nr:LysR family transcriptional regulator [Comamonas resistens]MDL5036409.1 LysR family transcriptional regulator [Comamonas resistens]WHS64752.1 LysR family transcriptional regulator [Comamonas resistens]
MDISGLDLNLLRVFDAVFRHGSVSRAAHELGLSQPAASQAVTRLRQLLGDPLFERMHGGVRPTPRAERLAVAVRTALATLEVALAEAHSFDPLQANQCFRIHLSDIGEARFLPPLMQALREKAPNVQLETLPMPMAEIADALDRGSLDIAIGFLPGVTGTQQQVLLSDRYALLLRQGHPVLRDLKTERLDTEHLRGLDYVVVRSHSETLRILRKLELQNQVRLSAAHFMAVPSIVRQTDLAVIMPAEIAETFVEQGGYVMLQADLPESAFDVSLHWSWRFAREPANQWLRELVGDVFRQRR